MDAVVDPSGEGAVYNIGTAARKSGLSVTTIRTWEERYGAVVPTRDASGRRLYSAEQIAQLAWLRQQTEAGLRASEAHRLLMAGEAQLGSPAAVVDHGVAWATLLAWAQQESEWLTSVLADLRRGLRSDAAAMATVIDNPVAGRVLSLTHLDPDAAESGALDRLAVVVANEVPGLEEALAGSAAKLLEGKSLGIGQDVVVAPIEQGGALGGALVAVGPSAEDPTALAAKAVRVIEARLEADRARSAFTSLLD
ncbi:MAG: MerR family transcriptional regulator [Acidimicrobiia bacterium]|jgi:DNA-binding transcriptional MerR regulator|nr:MerR family transcriptional regulator [Acidimicrobiia bacterium]